MHVGLCAAYFTVLLLLAMYGVHRSHLVITCTALPQGAEGDREGLPPPCRRRRTCRPRCAPPSRNVTIQLPLYNEATVAKRLVEHVANIDYPREKLEIQVLDDSTDETGSIVRAPRRRAP